MTAAIDVMPATGVAPILVALGLSIATFYRRRGHVEAKAPGSTRPTPERALSPYEQQRVLSVLHSDSFADKSPAEVFNTLLTQGTYHCSERTMYRLLADNDEVKERRNQLRHPPHKVPELIATMPNKVWSWDITKLLTYEKFRYLFLYVIIDIFSRYVVGWLLAEHENAGHAVRLVKETYNKYDVVPGETILHADRGAPMRSKLLSQLLAALDLGRSHGRPHVSNDNPFSESQFKTLKYHPTFPDRFGGMDDGNVFCRQFFDWYNNEHHHSGIAFLTPAEVHFGRAEQVLRHRHEVMTAAYLAHPGRFVRGPPRMQVLPPAVYINPPKSMVGTSEAGSEPSGTLATAPTARDGGIPPPGGAGTDAVTNGSHSTEVRLQ